MIARGLNACSEEDVVCFSTYESGILSAFGDEHGLLIIGGCDDLDVDDSIFFRIRIFSEQLFEMVKCQFW